MDNLSIGFIGAGVLGGGLSLALAAKGHQVAAVSSRTFSSAETLAARIAGCQPVADPQEVADRCRLVFITTPDEAIAPVASQVRWRSTQGVVHCSGALPLECLGYATQQGALAGSLHPFQTLACIASQEEGVARLEGATFAIEGEGWLGTLLAQMVADLGGRLVHWEPQYRALYHASAVLSCGYVAALLGAARRIWQELGYPPDEALNAILPITKSTLEAIDKGGIEPAITGPVVRGDVDTVERHLIALEEYTPALVPLYCSLGLQSLPLVDTRVGGQQLQKLEVLLREWLLKHSAAIPGR